MKKFQSAMKHFIIQNKSDAKELTLYISLYYTSEINPINKRAVQGASIWDGFRVPRITTRGCFSRNHTSAGWVLETHERCGLG